MVSKARQLAQSASAPEGRKNLVTNGAMNRWHSVANKQAKLTGDYTACDENMVKIVETGDTVD